MSLIDTHKNIAFTSRNPDIRRADDIVRLVNRVYPRVSPTLVACSNYIDVFDKMDIRYSRKIGRLRRKLLFQEKRSSSVQEKVRILPNLVKKYKVGNCGESAELAYYAAKANGYSDVRFAEIASSETGILDHMLVIVNSETNNPFIMDAWLGFADYVTETSLKYFGVFNRMFNFKNTVPEALEMSYRNVSVPEISVEEARKLFPELILEKGHAQHNVNKSARVSYIKILFNKLRSMFHN